MNDEIKEILDNVKKCCDITKDQSFTIYQRQDILTLLDYITNLQQENEKMSKRFRNCRKIKDNYKSRNNEAIQYLKCHSIIYKENEEECVKTDEYFNPYWCIDILEGNDEGLESLKSFVDYKERFRKALEYIEYINIDPTYNKVLIEILRGDSNEQ